MTILLTLLKLLSSTLAGLFGVLALLVEFKDDNGKTTKWGKIALIGVVASATVSLSTQVVEHWKAELSIQQSSKKAIEQMEKSERILTHLTELSRSSQPLSIPDIIVVLKLPSDFIGGELFISKLRELGKKLRTEKTDIYNSRTNEYSISSSQEGLATSYSIDQRSSLFPDKDVAPELHSLLAQTGVKLAFLSKETSLDGVVAEIQSGKSRPSLGYFGKYGDYAFDIDDEEIKISYDILKDEVELWVEGIPDDRFIRKNGRINSFPDFEESHMLLSVDYTMVPSLGGDGFPNLQSNRKLLSPSIIFIRTTGRDFTLRKLEEITNKEKYRVFSVGPIGSETE